jgi:hypothetical protein
MTGLGLLSFEAKRGIYLHPTYVVTPKREPVGAVNAWMWAQEFKQGDALLGGVLESVRWTESYERIAEQASEMPGTRHVCIRDRESNILALLVMAPMMNYAADCLERCQHNRMLPAGGKLWDEVMASAPVGRIRFKMRAVRGRKACTVEQEVRVQRVVGPDRWGDQLEVNCLIVSGVNAPAGARPVVWRLLTNRVASTLPLRASAITISVSSWTVVNSAITASLR